MHVCDVFFGVKKVKWNKKVRTMIWLPRVVEKPKL
jgi:hypothetical protein